MASGDAVFDRACEALEERTDFDRIEARGTVRIALKEGGLDAASVGAAQMAVVVRKLLPKELETRGVANAANVCEDIAAVVERVSDDGVVDRADDAAGTFSRFGS